MAKTLHKKALLLAYFTIGYNVLECGLSLIAGYLAGSIALVGFGLDSLAESLSGGVMIWRFAGRSGLTPEEEERLERRAIKIIGYAFFILAGYVLYESLEKLLLREIPAPSLLGMGIAIASLIVMPALFLIKYRTGKSLNSASLMADSRQNLACGLLSVGLLLGLSLNYLWGVWQADPAMGLVTVIFLAREGYQALKEKKLCSCAACGGVPARSGD